MINAPEKIYNWIETQLSIARFYGGCKYGGHTYTIDMNDPAYPLVRADVLLAEKRQAVQDKTTRRKDESARAAMAQGELI